jgi:hypothetical protein
MAGNHVPPRTSFSERPGKAAHATVPAGVMKVEARAPSLQKSRPAAIPPLLVWEQDDYPRVDGGLRMVRAHKIQGPEWVRAFSRWSLRIEFHLMDERGTVSLFLNLGTDRERPTVGGRKSRFYRFWTLANGGPPRKHEVMNYEIFLGKCFWARIEDCTKDSEGRPKLDGEKYSRIVDLEELIAQ